MWRIQVWNVGSAAERTEHLEQRPNAGKRSIPGGAWGTSRGRTRAWWAAAVHLTATLALFCSCSPALRCSQELPTCSSLANRPLACFLAELGLMWVWAPGVWYSTTLSPLITLGLSIHLLCPHLCPWHGRCGDRNPGEAGLGLALPPLGAFALTRERRRTFKVQGRHLQFIPVNFQPAQCN